MADAVALNAGQVLGCTSFKCSDPPLLRPLNNNTLPTMALLTWYLVHVSHLLPRHYHSQLARVWLFNIFGNSVQWPHSAAIVVLE